MPKSIKQQKKQSAVPNNQPADSHFKFQMIDINQIKPNPDNPRVIRDKGFQKMKKSIQDFPKMLFIRPIVIDKDQMIIGGNQRFEAVKDLKDKFEFFPMVPVCNADDLTEDERQQFIIKDNAHFGEWDFDQLANNWNTDDLDEWGLKGVPSMNDDPETVDDEFDLANVKIEEVKTDIKVGDIYQIGPHRLMCGDCVNEDHVKLLMNDQRAELLFTSPPYDDLREYNGNKNLNVSYLSGFINVFAPFAEYQCVNLGLKRKDHELVTYWDTYIDKARISGYKLMGWNAWVRSSAGSVGNQSAFIPVIHEFIFVFGYKFKHINRTVERKEYTIDAKKQTRAHREKDGSMRRSSVGIQVSMKEMESVFFSNPELGAIRKLHPATFPIELPAEYIKAITDPNQIICEPFAGSGTTMVASHQLGRICYAMELEPAFCQVTIDRMLKLDNNLKVIKIV